MPKKNPQNLPKPQSATKPAPNKSGDLLGPPADVIAIRKEIDAFFKTTADDGNKIGSHKWGIYAFFDYDGEPIYVGQTYEGLGSRIGRHLNNQRTDAVAMNVLDPFEVAEIRVWPLDVSAIPKEQRRDYLDRAENRRAQVKSSSFQNHTLAASFPQTYSRTANTLTFALHAAPLPSQASPGESASAA